jgi:hypothetical protein
MTVVHSQIFRNCRYRLRSRHNETADVVTIKGRLHMQAKTHFKRGPRRFTTANMDSYQQQ